MSFQWSLTPPPPWSWNAKTPFLGPLASSSSTVLVPLTKSLVWEPRQTISTSNQPGERARSCFWSAPGIWLTQPRPWWALSLTLLALFASLGGNVYLGWIAWESQCRYRAAVTGQSEEKPKATQDDSAAGRRMQK